MNDIILPVFGLSFVGSVLGMLGGIVLLFRNDVAKKLSVPLISFAAGVMLAITFLDLLPEALDHGGEEVLLISMLGLIFFFFTENFLLHFHHHEEHKHTLKSAVPLIVIGDSIHNFIDGIVIAASFIANPSLGVFVAIGTFIHELPQEIGDFAVLLQAGVSKTKVVLANLLSAAATFLGAGLTLVFVNQTQQLVGPMLGLAAGMFLYISSADILPEITKENHNSRWLKSGFFLAGVVMIFLLTKFVAE